METLGKDKKLKPWMTNGEDLEKELKRLGLRKEDLRLDRKPVMLDPENNLVDRVRTVPVRVFIRELQYIVSM